jgi:hypothetical protein
VNTPIATDSIALPTPEGDWRTIRLADPGTWAQHPHRFERREVFAAAHVVADPLGDNVPGSPATIDWDSTLAFRRELFSYGFGIAEAMDTAQRNMGLDWPAVKQLVRRSADQAASFGARIASGAGTDHRGALVSVDDVIDAYTEQVAFVESTGSEVILMASRHLAAIARGPDDYLHVYSRVLDQVSGPVILHWLGDVFDSQLRGYWGDTDIAVATETFLALVGEHRDKIDGVKVSLLSADHEIELRRQLPSGVRLYTGDDFNYPELIRGDGVHHSDALLGAFAAVAPAASAALAALDSGDLAGYDAAMAPTLPLARHLFENPTYHYKAGIAFLAWLNGHQPGYAMVGGLQSARSPLHLSTLFRLANDARLLRDPDLAATRMTAWLEVQGVQR